MMMIRSFLMTLGLALVGFADAEPDLVELTNGKTHEGRVVFEDDERLVLKVKSREKEFDKEDIKAVRAVVRELPGALRKIASLKSGDVFAHHELAKELEAKNLPSEAQLVHWSVLAMSPNDPVSHEALGHRKRGKLWTVPHKNRWYKLGDRKALLENWSGAWEFETTHFLVRSNQSLKEALETTLLLEQTYFGFYQLFGASLELRDVTEKIEAWVHADATSFPEALNGGRSYYSPGDRRLSVNAARGLNVSIVVHEATHAVLHASILETGSGRGKLPGWLDEGLAEYMAGGLRQSGRSVSFNTEEVNPEMKRAHANAKKPYRLNRVLNFQSGDFGGTSKTHLKYAQSYTLVHFLLHGESGAHRENFLLFLASVYEGKASSTHFKKILGVKEAVLEAAWNAYVGR